MKTRAGSLTDAATGIMSNKGEAELARIKKEQISRRDGTLEHRITEMMQPKPQPAPLIEK